MHTSKPNVQLCEPFFSLLNDLISKYSSLLIMGDFNLPDTNWNTLLSTSQLSNVFHDLVFKLNLSLLVDISTHNQGNIFILIFTCDEELIHTITVYPHETFSLCLDHYAITFDISLETSLPGQINSYQYVHDYTKANYGRGQKS